MQGTGYLPQQPLQPQGSPGEPQSGQPDIPVPDENPLMIVRGQPQIGRPMVGGVPQGSPPSIGNPMNVDRGRPSLDGPQLIGVPLNPHGYPVQPGLMNQQVDGHHITMSTTETEINFERDFGQWFNGDDDVTPYASSMAPTPGRAPAIQGPAPATNGASNTNVAPFSSSIHRAPRNPIPLVNGQSVLNETLSPPDFMQQLSDSLNGLHVTMSATETDDINFERDFGQWFNGDDITPNASRMILTPVPARGPRPEINGAPNTNMPPPPSSIYRDPRNPIPLVNQQPVPNGTLLPPDFMQQLSDPLDDFHRTSTETDINFERDFAQWFNGDDVSLT